MEDILSLPREELINLALTVPASDTSPRDAQDPVFGAPEIIRNSDGADSLEALEQAPEHDPDIDEAKRHGEQVQGIVDDVNGLSLSVDRLSSYVGISSITAAMKVIFKTAPVARTSVSRSYIETAQPSRSNSPYPAQMRSSDPNWLPPVDVGQKLIDLYFAHVHVLMPMVDENEFRDTYLYRVRRDSPWLALLNMVFALGSLAGSTSDNQDHIYFYQRSRKHLDLETFGSGSLWVLQSLGLMSGYYLHWLNRPNEANGIMGATFRMALALGLHREYTEGGRPKSAGGHVDKRGSEVPAEIRRRTWWSLYCLDSWASIATGRPSLGRTGTGISVHSPKIPEQNRMNNAQYLHSLKLLPIIHNVSLCKIATRVQDKLADQPLIKFEELLSLDAELEKWHAELPPILRNVVPDSQTHTRDSPIHKKGRSSSATASRSNIDFSQPPDRDSTPCPEILQTPRAIMHWRYQNVRMLLHRPFLLATALRRTPFASMSTEERLAVSRCRVIAEETIFHIESTCRNDLIAGWNAVWLMYQAVMVPLVSLFLAQALPQGLMPGESPGKTPEGSEGSGGPMTAGSDRDVNKWQQQIETAITFFGRMHSYSVAAKKSEDVVQRLYDASKHVRQQSADMPPILAPPPQKQQKQKQRSQQRQPKGQQQSQQLDQATMTGQNLMYDLTALPRNPTVLAPDEMQGYGFGPNDWSFNLPEDDAMNSFWDDMMWDTPPSNTNIFEDATDQVDWLQSGSMGLDSSQWGHDGRQ